MLKLSVSRGFTLIEMLVVLVIMGTIAALSYGALQGAKASSRDAQRRTDLQSIRSALEIYRVDCGTYPTSLDFTGTKKLVGPAGTSCAGNVYLDTLAQDPLKDREGYQYEYSYNSSTKTYTVCSFLEQVTAGDACGGDSSKRCKSGPGAPNSCELKLSNP